MLSYVLVLRQARGSAGRRAERREAMHKWEARPYHSMGNGTTGFTGVRVDECVVCGIVRKDYEDRYGRGYQGHYRYYRPGYYEHNPLNGFGPSALVFECDRKYNIEVEDEPALIW